MLKIAINNRITKLEVDPDTPLLWVLRDNLALTGAKYACGTGICGSCTVLVDNQPVRSCITPIADIQDKRVVTIEGLSEDLLESVEDIWTETGASECGFCQPGQVMAALALLIETPQPTDMDIDNAMSGNLCRCGIYQRIRKAIHKLASTGIPEKLSNE